METYPREDRWKAEIENKVMKKLDEFVAQM
ncbi:hypothetical protein MNV_720006 [Candidatus Methanoperedens nitroreducens]|uniref:Uncharacterized protein n=1 Tax=Candidatus Methanoperedens nitratireducens TaxID=1392998 RepID=A0A284VTA1_9EURY|nr:hypothetical protein MNV_720006 [Candidatus Methanoperedens nitroreducens]